MGGNTELTVEAAAKFKVAELKDELTKRGLEITGLKDALFKRLRADIEASGSKVEEAEKVTVANSPKLAAKQSPKKSTPKKSADTAPEIEMPAVSLVDDVLVDDDEDEKERSSKPSVDPEKNRGNNKEEKEREPSPEKEVKKVSRPEPVSVSAIDRVMDTSTPRSAGKRGRDDDMHANGNKRARSGASGNDDAEHISAPDVDQEKWTNTLSIANFVRPFTQQQLKDLLSETGTVEDMWLNVIKSHCYVRYSSAEEAERTRKALYRKKWPDRVGRLLLPEFSTQARLEELKNGSAPKAVTPTGARPLLSGEGTSNQVQAKAAKVVSLDELFRKTSAKPMIYYLPLTVEEVARKKALASQRRR